MVRIIVALFVALLAPAFGAVGPVLSFPVAQIGAQLTPQSPGGSYFQVIEGGNVKVFLATDKTAAIAQYAADPNFGGWEIMDSADDTRRVFYKSDVQYVFSVKSYGAIGNGTTDDTAAINAAIAAMRAARTTTPVTAGSTIELTFPPGTYKTTDSINLTGIVAANNCIDGNGAVIYGCCAGKPVVDMMATRFMNIRDLVIYGDSTSEPTYGLQMGKLVAANPAGNGNLVNVHFDGKFSVSSFYNFAAEGMKYDHCKFWNNDGAGTAYCVMLDCQNDQNITSAFGTQTIAVGSAQSFNEQLFESADIRQFVSGKAVKLIGSNLRRTHFLNSYCVTVNDSAFHLYKASEVRQLVLDVHCETTGVTNNLLVDNTNPAGSVAIMGLVMRDHAPVASNALIETTGGSRNIIVENFYCEVGDPTNSIPIFGTANLSSTHIVSGTIAWQSSKTLNPNCLFTGNLISGTSPTITAAVGAYRQVNRPAAAGDRANIFKGDMQVIGTAAGTAPNDYVQLQGSDTAGTIVTVSAGGPDANIDLALSPKGTGNVRVGTYTATGDVAVNGYITIKDSSGTVRHLATVP